MVLIRELADTTSATYTPSGQPATATDANGNVTRFAYDLLDRRSRVTDPIGRTTSFTYDPIGRPFRTYNTAIQAGPLLQQTYTLNGQRDALTDANGNTTNFAYDGFDRLATTTYPATSAYPSGTTETYAYDVDGNVTKRCTRAGLPIAFTYDTLNRLLTKTLPGAATACGNMPSGTVVTYTYDRAGRVTGVSDNGAVIAAVAATSTVFRTDYTYDPTNRLTDATFDPAPTPTPPSTSSSVTFTHGYNGANQRSTVAVTDNTWINYPAASASATCYTVNELNQYTDLRFTSALNCTGGTTAIPAYDNNGNLTDDGSTYRFEYDAENRLVTSKTSGGSTIGTYAFDAQGRRKSKTVGGTTTIFATDAENREVLEYDGTTGAIQRWYAYGPGPNDVLGNMNVAAGMRSTPVPDILGSIIGVMDASTGNLASFSYRPYGVSASTPGQFGFTGQRVDAEDGLYYYRARHYSPVWGRFLQVDPAGYSDGPHLYAYAANDPLNRIDPNGLLAEQIRDAANNAFRLTAGFAQGVYQDTILRMRDDVTREAQRFADDPLAVTRKLLNTFPATKVEGELATAAIAAVSAIRTLGSGWRVLAPTGEGAATGVLPNGYQTVSRWVGPDEAAAWMAQRGTGMPTISGSNRMYVTELGAAKPGGTGPIRVDFAVPEAALQSAGKPGWFQIFQPTPSRPIYNVQVHAPPGVTIPGY